MTKFVMGMIFGIVVATVGITGISKILDKGVNRVQDAAKEAAQ